jgi:hypothetical protein
MNSAQKLALLFAAGIVVPETNGVQSSVVSHQSIVGSLSQAVGGLSQRTEKCSGSRAGVQTFVRKNEERKTNRDRGFAEARNVRNDVLMIDNHDLCDRTFRFACDVSKLRIRLQERGAVVRRLSMKLLDSGTSIGANIEEGRAGQSKPDFIAKNFISLKESRDTLDGTLRRATFFVLRFSLFVTIPW